MACKLVGQNYSTPDLVAKVTGNAKYAEDYQADGMLFCRLLLSPLPHARIRSIDTSAALAMPGVKAILLPSDIPTPADHVTDLGQTIKANTLGEKALTSEPVYQGEPVLAVAAVDELTAVEAIEKIEIDWEPLPVHRRPDRLAASRLAERPHSGQYLEAACSQARTTARRARASRIQVDERGLCGIRAKVSCPWARRLTSGSTATSTRLSRMPRSSSTKPSSRRTRATRRSSPARRWRTGRTASCTCTVRRRARFRRSRPSHDGCSSSRPTSCSSATTRAADSAARRRAPSRRSSRRSCRRKPTRRFRCASAAKTSTTSAARGRPCTGASRWRSRKRAASSASTCSSSARSVRTRGDGDGGSPVPSSRCCFSRRRCGSAPISVLTNTPPRRAQSQPGGFQGITIMEPLLAKAARKLGIDQVAIRKINAPEGKAQFGPANPRGQRGYATSAFVKEALDKGAETFNWDARKAQSGKRVGTKVRGVGVAVSGFVAGSTGFDGLFVLKPDGQMYIQTGVGNLGTESIQRHQSRVRRNDGDAVGEGRAHLGRLRARTSRGPASPAAARRRTR